MNGKFPWISVKEQKPEMYTEIFGYDADSGIYCFGSYCSNEAEDACTATDGEYFFRFTHWIYPEKPEE